MTTADDDPATEALAERLRAQGIDPESFLKIAPAAAERAGGERAPELLGRLATLAEQVHAAGFGLYFPFESDVAPLSTVLAGHPDRFLRTVDEVGALATALGERATKSIQRGIPSVCRAAKERPWIAEAALAMARALGEAGADPGETLLQAVLELAETVGADRATYERSLAAVQAFVLALDARGVHATYPIQQGICGAIAAWSDELDALPEVLGDLSDLVGALQDAGISPYPVLEYGVSTALPPTRDHPWLRAEVFPLAATLAGQGIDPTLTLRQGIAPLAYASPERGRAGLAWAQGLAADGVDPGWFLGFNLDAVSAACVDDDAFARALTGVDALARAIAAHDHQPMLTFQYGLLGVVGQLDLDRVLAASTALAQHGIDPGPPLSHGYGALAYLCAERATLPELTDAALTLAESLVAAGHSPWRALEYGLPGVLAAAGNDEPAAIALLEVLGDLLADLHTAGIATDDLLMYGIHSLGKSLRGERALFERLLGYLRELVADLAAAGFSPIYTVGTGLPAVTKAAESDPGLLERAVDFARQLASSGIDPAPLLTHAAPALGADQLDAIAALCQAAHRAGLATEPLGKALAALGEAEAGLADALAVSVTLAREGIDPASALSDSLPTLLRLSDATDRPAALAALADGLRAARRANLPSGGLDSGAFTRAVEVTGGASEPLTATLTALVDAGATVAAQPAVPLEAFLRCASSAAASVAGRRPAIFRALVERLAAWAAEHASAPGLDAALQRGLSALATAAGDDPGAFERLLAPLTALTPLDEASALFESAFTAARLGAGADPAALEVALGDLHRLGVAGADAGLLHRIHGLTSLVRRLPETWSGLIVPACLGVGAGAPVVLDCVRQLERYLKDADDLTLVKEIVTHHGVRAPDLLSGLLLTGLRRGKIGSLGSERELLLSFLSDVPFADADYYAEYRRIMTDPDASPAERRAHVEALHQELMTITRAVVAGEVSTEQERHALFGQVLTYVFPPARSFSRHTYLSLYQRFPDRPDDLLRLAERGALPAPEVELATGGYRIRDGSRIDAAPWEPLVTAVSAVTEAGDAEAPADLGQALFEAWIAGDLGKARTRDDLLTRIYRVHRAAHAGLPDALDDAGAFLKYREFLSDTAREITQDALAAFRAAQPERYERQARAKLDPRRRPGQGLLRGVARTIAAVRAGDLARDAALERLGRQLKGYDLSEASTQDRLLEAQPDELAAVVDALPARAEPVALGEEHHRVLADLVGRELAAMRRELFGEGGEAGKLEYSRDGGGPPLTLRLQPTKRKAHAPVGVCEGVCTASDQRLWETPEFLQCVFWGPNDRARGGMHLLRVEREHDGVAERALSLPGINPSLELLREVGSEAILDAALEFARALARAWNLTEVWIPTHRAIATNRGPIRQVLEQRDLPVRSVASVSFSHSPYRYTFDEVWVLMATA